MPTRTFDKEFMIEEVLENVDDCIISDTVCGKSRWSVIHELIFKFKDKFYKTNYSVAATEMQDEQPWQYSPDVRCREVHPVEKTMIVYVNVPD